MVFTKEDCSGTDIIRPEYAKEARIYLQIHAILNSEDI